MLLRTFVHRQFFITYSYHMTYQSHFWPSALEKQKFILTQKPVYKVLQQLYSRLLKLGKKTNKPKNPPKKTPKPLLKWHLMGCWERRNFLAAKAGCAWPGNAVFNDKHLISQVPRCHLANLSPPSWASGEEAGWGCALAVGQAPGHPEECVIHLTVMWGHRSGLR